MPQEQDRGFPFSEMRNINIKAYFFNDLCRYVEMLPLMEIGANEYFIFVLSN